MGRILKLAAAAAAFTLAVIGFSCLMASGSAHAEMKTISGNYALLEGTTLTFRYSADETSVTADAVYTGFDTESYAYIGSTPWYSNNSSITKIVFDGSAKGHLRPISTERWFEGMGKLESVEGLGNLDTSAVTDMNSMFNGCWSLASLDVSGFDTSAVKHMGYMFSGCSKLASLNVSSWNTSAVTFMPHMFYECRSLRTIVSAADWSGAKDTGNTSDMFSGCTSLAGGNGTAYSADHVDAEYARADMPGSPGYFTSAMPADISGATVTVSPSSYIYDGSAKRPSVTVTLNGAVLPASAYDVTYSDNVDVGTATVTVTGKGDYEGTAKGGFTIVEASDSDPAPTPTPGATNPGSAPAPAPVEEKKPMHRLYNPNSGEHFYTSDDAERDYLVSLGWSSEGEGWKAPESSNTPVYRMYNPVAGEHHYTPNAEERDNLIAAGWNDEGVGWYSDDAQTVPLYRDYNPNAFANNHNYTADADEHAALAAAGWVDEGIAWYGV